MEFNDNRAVSLHVESLKNNAFTLKKDDWDIFKFYLLAICFQ